MSEDNFIHEVTEELKYEQMHALWGKYGIYVIIAVVCTVIFTGVYQVYAYMEVKKAASLGDQLLVALGLPEKSQDVALQKLSDLEHRSRGNVYSYLAEMQMANIYASKKDDANASKYYDMIISDHSAPELLRNVARIKEGYLYIDSKDTIDIGKLVVPCMDDENIFQPLAWEIMGLSNWRSGNVDLSRKYFNKIIQKVPEITDIYRRAAVMLSVINASNKS